MSSEKISNKISVIMSSSVFLILASIVFFRAMTFDLNTMLHALKISLTGAFAAGILGYVMGSIFENSSSKPKKKRYARENEGLIDDLLVDDMQHLDKEIN
jgi:membrane protein YqaA with SNARE-associated domain